MKSINVTKTYLPAFDEYIAILKRAWDMGWITNNGILVQELEQQLKDYLRQEYVLFCSNGTIALQLALKALDITGQVITTPFSYVATTNVILWEGCTPVFVDIEPNTFCIDADKIEAAITKDTQAILATHVYGFPCDVEKIEDIAKRHNLKVIYDGAHAFGCTYKGKSLLNFGDISTCSFHATKIFHTVEGGCVISNSKDMNDKLFLYRSFGHIGDDYYSIGINGKNSEFHAAMGLCVMKHLDNIIYSRKCIIEQYDSALLSIIKRPVLDKALTYNYGYYPILLKSEVQLLIVVEKLKLQNIAGRRYFYPSLNELPYLKKQSCPIAEDISKRILCLPLYSDLKSEEVLRIISCIQDSCQR